MASLENILQEIEEKIQMKKKVWDSIEKPPYSDFEQSLWVAGMRNAKEVIYKHLPDNDGWIPVDPDNMPEANTKVNVTFREWMEYSKKYRYGTCNAVYIPEKKVRAEDIWTDYEEDDQVEYDEETDIVYAIGGWCEVIEHWGDYSHCYINCEVVAWQPLPEPYKPRKDGE